MAHNHGQQREHRYLGREGLGRGHANFGAGVGVGAGIGGAGNAAAHHVADTENGSALALGQLHGGQRVGRFAALRNGNHDVALRNHGVAVAEFGGVLHFHRNAGQVFNQVLGHQAGVPGSAAGHDDDALGIHELLLVGPDAAHVQVAGLQLQAPAHGVEDGAGLLKNLLEHEVLVAAFLDAVQLQLQLLDVRRLLHVLAAANVQLRHL